MLQRCFHSLARALGACWPAWPFCVLLLASLFPAAPAHAEPAQVRLAAFQVVSAMQDGAVKERLQPLDKIKPGDTIEYEATYANVTGAKVSGVQLTVPVPDGGLVLLDGGANPSTALASLDGKTYKPMPLTRVVMLPDGRTVTRRVPPAEIRFLRWDLGDVPAGATRSVRARMQMPAVPAVASTSFLSTPTALTPPALVAQR